MTNLFFIFLAFVTFLFAATFVIAAIWMHTKEHSFMSRAKKSTAVVCGYMQTFEPKDSRRLLVRLTDDETHVYGCETGNKATPENYPAGNQIDVLFAAAHPPANKARQTECMEIRSIAHPPVRNTIAARGMLLLSLISFAAALLFTLNV